MPLPPLIPSPYSQSIFRNIATCAPSQHLLDDLCDEEDFAGVDQIIQLSSEISFERPKYERPFQYGKIEDPDILAVFSQDHWGPSRFSDGYSYGVWYGAEKALTSIYEAAWWAYQLGKDNIATHEEIYTSDRVMYQAEVKSLHAVDLTRQKKFYSQLIQDDYDFCHRLGHQAMTEGIEMFRTFSARHHGGICTPLFSPKPIQKSEIYYYLRFHIDPAGLIEVTSSHAEANFSFHPAECRAAPTPD